MVMKSMIHLEWKKRVELGVAPEKQLMYKKKGTVKQVINILIFPRLINNVPNSKLNYFSAKYQASPDDGGSYEVFEAR